MRILIEEMDDGDWFAYSDQPEYQGLWGTGPTEQTAKEAFDQHIRWWRTEVKGLPNG